jgi:hypothetical protein
MKTIEQVRKHTTLSLAVLALSLSPAAAKTTVHVDFGTDMKYLANASDPVLGVTWVERTFDDSTWSAGQYGVGFEAGSGAENLILTETPSGLRSIYTRATFEIADASAVRNLFLGHDYDDGVAAWINGVEVFRSSEMPEGDLDWDTAPSSRESSNGLLPDFRELVDISTVALPELRDGTNVLAVGVWNRSASSSDHVVVPKLIMDKLPRGPYLQQATETSIVVRWRTTDPTDSLVRYGSAPGSLTLSVGDPTLVTEHVVELGSLTPDSRYVYSVGSTAEVMAGDDPDHFFRTLPVSGTRRPYRIWAIGDSGTADSKSRAVRNAYKATMPYAETDIWLMLGDNAYPDGSDSDHQAAVFDTFPDILRSNVLWPTFGNHDAHTASSGPPVSGVYYDVFTMPTAGEAGGLTSGTEAYYAFDHGNIHFVSLNSQDVDREPGSDMLVWLEQDLAATLQDWIIAFWHHTPYSKGHHDSDVPSDSGGRMWDMREYVLPILEAGGVDLALVGHNHTYERSYLLDGHYGTSDTITEAMKLDPGDGRVGGDGAYQKTSQGPAGHEGAVYVAAGNAGSVSTDGPLNHPAMVVNMYELGSVVIELEGDQLTTKLLMNDGTFGDEFTIVKNTGVAPVAEFSADPTAGPAPLSVSFTNLSTTNTAAWTWYFDEDEVPDSIERNPVHVFDAGSHTVSLVASNASGTDQETKVDLICASGVAPEVSGLVLSSGGTLSWADTVRAVTYDVIKGDLHSLRDLSGDFAASVTECLANDISVPATDDPEPALDGQAFYYLVRGASCADEIGTYDGGGPGQVASREVGIAGSALDCP